MHKVLITKELNKSQRALAHEYGLEPVEHPFIKIKFEYDTVSFPAAESWIVTSPNAAKYIASHFEEFPKDVLPQTIFAIGDGTADHIDHLGIKIDMPSYGTGKNMVELVKKSGVKSAIFFSGNLRSNTITDGLQNEIELTEKQVYETEILADKVDLSGIKGIAFFSPSGVTGFAKQNKVTNQIVIAIGTVTKKAVKEILNLDAGIPASTKVEDVLFALKQDLRI